MIIVYTAILKLNKSSLFINFKNYGLELGFAHRENEINRRSPVDLHNWSCPSKPPNSNHIAFALWNNTDSRFSC